MSDERRDRRVAAFLQTAGEDLDAAQLLAESGNRLAAFHVQQAIEKLTKAGLLARGIEAGLEHHLDALLKRLPEEDAVRSTLWPLRGYSVYATAFRYPTPRGNLTPPPAKDQLLADIANARQYAVRVRDALATPQKPGDGTK